MSFPIEDVRDVISACGSCPSRTICKGFLYCNNPKNTSSATISDVFRTEASK